MASSFIVVPFAPAHLPALADLWVATWARTMPEIDFEARRPWLLEHIAKLHGQGAETHVALDAPAGAPAGFVIIDPNTGYLDQLAVAPAHWGQGAAEALMAAAQHRAPAGIALDVNQDNPRAVAFYQKLGFTIASAGQNPMSGRAIWRMEWRPAA
ncbi:GNAT family N-acetyltransferase [Roseixanthobacter glucoisosaccharinicivorans]|uniref:GNAT family N-acetyltransferase n=1 Tax=Roseixanthobacter glucoisosaccharinicivorans TaxID=3119923 RepID=UPI00372ADD84